MNRFRHTFVSPRIKSQILLPSNLYNDQNASLSQIKKQFKAPPKHKSFFSKKILTVANKQSRVDQLNNQRLKSKGKLNQFCQKHVFTLKQQFPQYFQSILNQLKQEGSVQFQDLQECQNQQVTTSFNQHLSLNFKQTKENQIENQESQFDSINSFQQKISSQKQKRDVSKQKNSIQLKKNSFHLLKPQSSLEIVQANNIQQETEQFQIQNICKKHIENINKMIQQMVHIKKQLISDMRKMLRKYKTKQIQFKGLNQTQLINLNNQCVVEGALQNNLQFPKVPLVLTLQNLRNQIKQSEDNKINLNVRKNQCLNYTKPIQKLKKDKKKQSSPIKMIKFAQENSIQSSSFKIIKIEPQCPENINRFQTNNSKQISFKLQTQQKDKNSQNSLNDSYRFQFQMQTSKGSNLQKIFAQKQNQSFKPQILNKPQIFNKLQILNKSKQNVQTLNKNYLKEQHKNIQNQQSMYLHRENSLKIGYLEGSFEKRLDDNYQKIQQKLCISNISNLNLKTKQQQCSFNEHQQHQNTFQYSQSQFQQEQKTKLTKKSTLNQNILAFSTLICPGQHDLEKQSNLSPNQHNLEKQLNQKTILNSNQQSRKESMLLSSYQCNNKKRQDSVSIQRQERDSIKEQRNPYELCFNSNIRTQFNEKKQVESKGFFSYQQCSQISSFFDEQLNDSNQKQGQSIFDQQFGVSSINVSSTPPNIKKIKQKVMQYKIKRQQKKKQQTKKVTKKGLEFNKNIKLKFKKVQQKKNQNHYVQELLNNQKQPQKVLSFLSKDKICELREFNEEKEITCFQNIQAEEPDNQLQNLRQIKNKQCIYYENRKKQIYNYPWFKFR